MNCKKCGKCCRKFEATIDQENPVNEKAVASIKKVFANGSMKMVLSRYENIKIRIEGPCRYLNCDNKCEIYDDRPEICKKFYCEEARKV